MGTDPDDPVPERPDELRSSAGSDRAVTMLPRDRRSAAGARDWLAAFLAGRVDGEQAEDATLVMSELATNALRHGVGDVVVRAAVEPDGTVRLAVTDAGDELPEMQPVDPDRIGGLGLRIVDQLTSAWGVAPFPGGKTVWATIPRRP